MLTLTSTKALPDTGPITTPTDQLIASLPRLVDRLELDPFRRADLLETAIAAAEALDPAQIAVLRRSSGQATAEETKSFLQRLVTAWPNATRNDLAGYALQLAEDVKRHRPSRYALEEGSRMLRRTSRFVPSISEVLDAIETAETKITLAAGALDKLPRQLEQARIALAIEAGRLREEERRYLADLNEFVARKAGK